MNKICKNLIITKYWVGLVVRFTALHAAGLGSILGGDFVFASFEKKKITYYM